MPDTPLPYNLVQPKVLQQVTQSVIYLIFLCWTCCISCTMIMAIREWKRYFLWSDNSMFKDIQSWFNIVTPVYWLTMAIVGHFLTSWPNQIITTNMNPMMNLIFFSGVKKVIHLLSRDPCKWGDPPPVCGVYGHVNITETWTHSLLTNQVVPFSYDRGGAEV